MHKRFTILAGSLVFMLSTVLALTGFGATAHAVVDNTPDCDDGVAVVNCGVYSIAAARQKYTQGDIGKIYSAFGISRSDLSGDFKEGIVWRNGKVTVNGEVVATDAITAGRNFGGTPIPGTNAGKYPTSKFATEGQTAFIKMVNGKFSFAIIKSCGNPVTATPKQPPQPPAPTPAYECVSLNVEKITRTKYKFTAHATASGGATIEKYEFGFGDGYGITVTENTYTYDYKKTVTFNTNVVVHVKVNGQIKKVTSRACEKPVTVSPPPTTPVYACTALKANLISKANRTYGFTLTYQADGGAALRDVDFAFGDGATQTGVTPAQLASVQHSFPRDGKYTTIATLHFTVPGSNQVKDKNCRVEFEVSPEACEFNPSLPKDSPECKEAPLPSSVASTGPTDMALGGLGLGSLAGAGYYWRASRNRLIAKLLNR